LGDIPVVKWFGFSNDSKEVSDSELVIALVPRIVRRPDINDLDLRGIAAGNDTNVKLSYASNGSAEEQETPQPETTPAAPAAEPQPPAAEPPAPAEPPAVPAPATAPAALRFNPAEVTTTRGSNFSVSLMIDNATDVFNAPLRFQFNPQLLRLNEIQRGAFLAGDGQQVIFTRNILNDSGNASVVLNRLPGSSGALLTLTFQAIGQGAEADVQVSDSTIRDSKMETIPVSAPVLRVRIE
jgi:hypothetical protein